MMLSLEEKHITRNIERVIKDEDPKVVLNCLEHAIEKTHKKMHVKELAAAGFNSFKDAWEASNAS